MSASVLTAGTVYRWTGLPGQYDNESRIRLEHFGSNGRVTTAVIGPDGNLTADTIALSDLVQAINLGLLEPIS